MLKAHKGRIDTVILAIVFILVGVGIVMSFSIGSIISQNKFYYPLNHIIKILIGIVLMYIFSKIDYHSFQRKGFLFLLISIFFLIVVLLPKLYSSSGVHRWLRFVFFNFQPSEMAKVVLIIFLADVLSRKQNIIKSFTDLYIPLIIIVGLVFFLIVLEPDFGTAVTITLVSFFIMIVGGVPKRYIIGTILVAAPLIYLLITHSHYRYMRFLGFLHPELDPLGINYQINQSLISIGKGGFLGVGIGQSSQKLFYLPESHTDFVFSIFAEETGFIGSLILVCLYFLIFIRSIKIARSALDLFGFLLASGIGIMIVLYALINIGVVTSILPNKGLPLPFISYGGSSMLFNLISIGILLNISRHVLDKVER